MTTAGETYREDGGTGGDVEWDLDAPDVPPRRGGHPLVAAAVVLVAIAATLGAAIRTVTTPAPEVRGGIGARLTLQETHLQGRPAATLRLTVRNDTGRPAGLARLDVQGVSSGAAILGHNVPGRLQLKLDRALDPGEVTAVDVAVRPTCGRVLGTGRLTAQMLLTDGRPVAVLLERDLERPGGLCRRVNDDLPAGWQSRLSAARLPAPDPDDLRIRLTGLEPDGDVAGIWAGTTLLLPRRTVPLDGPTWTADLRHPGACPAGPGASGEIPTGLRVLISAESGLIERYAVLGPTLAQWLLKDCPA